MEKEKMLALEKRLTNEKELFHKRPYDKGVEVGMLDRFEFSYAALKKFTAMFNEHYDLSDFTGEEKELKELYEFVRSEKKEKKFSIKIERHDNRETIEGLYNVAISQEEAICLPLADIDEEDRHRYLKGWLSIIYEVWQELDLRALQLE